LGYEPHLTRPRSLGFSLGNEGPIYDEIWLAVGARSKELETAGKVSFVDIDWRSDGLPGISAVAMA
jgi:hypothetical protein